MNGLESPEISLNDGVEKILGLEKIREILSSYERSFGFALTLYSIKKNRPILTVDSRPEATRSLHCDQNKKNMLCDISSNSLHDRLNEGKDYTYIQCRQGLAAGALLLKSGDSILGEIHTGPLISGIQECQDRKDFPIFNKERLFHSLFLIKESLVSLANQVIKDKEIRSYERVNQDRSLFLNRMIDQSPFATWISDRKGTMIRCNRSLTRILNLEPDQLLGKYNILEDVNLIGTDNWDLVNSVYQEGKTVYLEQQWEGYKQNKTDIQKANHITVQATLFPIFDSEKEMTNVVCHWIDITQRKRAEEELHTHKEQLEAEVEKRTRKLKAEILKREKIEKDLLETQTIFDAFLEYNPIYVFFKDKDIRSLRLSRNYEKLLGKPLDELLGKTMDDLFPSDLAKSMIADDKKILREEKLLHIEEEMEGSYFETIKFPIYIKGKPEILAGFTIDITKRKKAELELLEANARTTAIIENKFNSIWAIDHEYRIIYMNQVFRDEIKKSFGLEMKQGTNILENTPLDLLAQWKNRIDRALRGESFQVEDKLPKPEGGFSYIHLGVNPIIVGDTVTGASFFSRDVTEWKMTEQQMRQSQKLDSLGQLAGGVAHNFNNMLSAIMGCTEFVQQRVLGDEESQHYLSMILESSEKAADLARKLITFAKPQDQVLKKVNLEEMIERSLAILKNTVNKKLDLAFERNARNDVIIGDSSQLQSVIINLAINASQAIIKSGEIRFITDNISLSAGDCTGSSFDLVPGDYIRIKVVDNGPGISETNINRIFDPFFTTKEQGKGTGLGLSTTMGTVQLHRGSIEVKSVEGEGTCFTLLFPLAQSKEKPKPFPS